MQEKMQKPIAYCLYARKSSESEERQSLSIDSQIKEMQKLAEREGLAIKEIKRERRSAKSRGDRPIFNELINDIRFGKFGGILTWATDRLSRNAGDLGALVDLMDAWKLVDIRTFNQRFTNSPNEKFLLMILGSQAKLENDNRSVNVKRGIRSRVQAGLWPGPAPIGYLNQNRIDKRCELILDTERMPIIKKMFEKVANDRMSIRKIYQWLKDTGFRTHRGKVFAHSSVQRTLNNPFYYGRFEHPKKSGKWHTGKHEPIITKALFEKVQKRLHRIETKRSVKEFSFVRLFTCGLCGSGIVAEDKIKQLSGGTIVHYIYYGCSRGRDRFCKNSYIREEELIKELIGIVDTAEIDELGIRYKFDEEVTRYGKFLNHVLGKLTDLRVEEIELNIRAYAKYVLMDGSKTEKRELLGHLRSRLVYTHKKFRLLPTEQQGEDAVT